MNEGNERLLHVKTVADMLGLHPQQVYRLIHSRKIGAKVLHTRTYRIPRSELEAFMGRCEKVDLEEKKE